MTLHIAATVDEIPPGGVKLVEIGRRRIALFNVDGEFLAIADRCPHEGASLCKGRIVGQVEADAPGAYTLSRPGEWVRCPWHGWEFDLRTGQSRCEPRATRVRAFETALADGATLVEEKLQAETFAVAVDKHYVLIDL